MYRNILFSVQYSLLGAQRSQEKKLVFDSSQLTFLPTSKSRDTKTRPRIKNPAWRNLDIVP